MNIISSKIQKWVPAKNGTNSNNLLSEIYYFSLRVDFSSALNHFRNRIKEIKYNFVDGATSSGAVCFFGSIIMSLLQLGYVKNIDELFTFSSCYILLDHYLDDDTISLADKKEAIKQISSFINGNTSENNHEIIRTVAERYQRMVTKIPTAVEHLKALFQIEVESMHLQSNPNLTREQYLSICERKGGLTCVAIQALLELEVSSTDKILGEIIQICDDTADIEDDIAANIHTIATHDFKTKGNLDDLLIYCVDKIDELDNKYNFFKPILLLGLIFAVHINQDKYTPQMLEIIEPFIHYNPGTTKEKIVKWFQHKLVPHLENN